MPIAVGVIETQGFPAMLATADAMVKAGRAILAKFLLGLDDSRSLVTS